MNMTVSEGEDAGGSREGCSIQVHLYAGVEESGEVQKIVPLPGFHHHFHGRASGSLYGKIGAHIKLLVRDEHAGSIRLTGESVQLERAVGQLLSIP